ncbi:cell division protein FtsL [Embleya sp. NPDC055664]
MSGAAKTMTRIRLAARRAKGTTRTPFVVLVVGLLGGGLLSLLLLNTALNQGSFEVGRLQKRQDQLTDDREALQRELDARAAPGELARRAQELGLVPGGSPVFIDPATGRVLGVPKPATSKPPLVPEAPATPAGATAAPPAGGGPGVPVAQAGADPAGASAPATPAAPAAPAVETPATIAPPVAETPAAPATPAAPEAAR